MNISTIAHYASTPHGMTAYAPAYPDAVVKDHHTYTAVECTYGSDCTETRAALRRMVDRGQLELRTRTVDLGPPAGLGNWPEMEPSGVVTLRTWHLTEAGREAWLANDW